MLVLSVFVSGCAQRREAMTPQAALEAGWREYRLGEFDRATENFDAAAAATSGATDEHLQALYGQATTWNLRRPGEDPAQAKQLFEEIIRLAPTNEMAAWSTLALARMKHLVPVGEEPDYDAVRAAYQEVIDKFPGHLAAKEAFLYLNATLVATLKDKETRQAVASLEAYVNQTNESAFVGTCCSLLANCFTTLDEPEKRLAIEIRALSRMELDPQNPFNDLAWAYWNIATIAEFEVGDFAVAREYYQRLIQEYPTDIRKYGCKLALTRMDDLEAKLRAEVAP
jgi:tetratricopeptide (TPR) repeat protein